MYGPIYHGTFFFYFLEKYLKKSFVLPALPSNEKNSSDHHNSYNKGPNLAFFSFTESPSNSLLTIKFPKNHITSFNHRNLPKTAKSIFGHQRALGVNAHSHEIPYVNARPHGVPSVNARSLDVRFVNAL
jgi:hypothetical protein